MKKTNIQIISKDGVASLATSLTSIGSDLIKELRAISKRLHEWAKRYGRRLRLLWLHTPSRLSARKCTEVLTEQRPSKISPQKKSESKLEKMSVRSCSNYSIKGELPTVRERLIDKEWAR